MVANWPTPCERRNTPTCTEEDQRSLKSPIVLLQRELEESEDHQEVGRAATFIVVESLRSFRDHVGSVREVMHESHRLVISLD